MVREPEHCYRRRSSREGMTMANDFDGIDRGTQMGALAMPNGPLTDDVLAAAAKALADAAPAAACGSEERPHHYYGTAKIGERVRCVVCAERFVILPDGRAMAEPVLADFFQREPLRFLDRDPGKSVFTVPPEYRYSDPGAAPSRHPLHVYYDEISAFTEESWRRVKHALRHRKNRTRSTRRTDFASRGVPLPVLDRKA